MVSYVIVVYLFCHSGMLRTPVPQVLRSAAHTQFRCRCQWPAAITAMLGRKTALERSETFWKHLMKSPFASICITAQFLFRWYKTAYEETHALQFDTKWHKYGMPAKTHAISCSCSESGISKQSRQNHILDDASMKNKSMSANNQPMSFWSPHLQDLWSLSKIPKKPGKNPTKRNGCQVASVSSGPKFSSRNSCSARKSSQLHLDV